MANPLKILTQLTASSGAAVTTGGLVVNGGGVTINNNSGLVVNSNGITVNSGGASITGLVSAQNGVTVAGDLLTAQQGAVVSGNLNLSASSAIQVAGTNLIYKDTDNSTYTGSIISDGFGGGGSSVFLGVDVGGDFAQLSAGQNGLLDMTSDYVVLKQGANAQLAQVRIDGSTRELTLQGKDKTVLKTTTAGGSIVISGSTTTSGSLTVGGNGELSAATASLGGLTVSTNGIVVSAGGANITGQLTANTGLVVNNSALLVSGGGISGSATLQVGGASTLVGAVEARNGLIVTGSVTATSALSASAISASSYIGNGSGLTSLTASQISNFTSDVRGQFSNGTGVTITNGSVAIGQAVGTTDNVTFNTVTASNAVFQTASIGVLNYVSGNAIQLGDKYVTIASGASDHTSLDGSGFLWGSGAVGATHASILYRSTGDLLEISPNLSSSNVSASGDLTVLGTATFSGAVNLGNNSADVVTVNGQLTASQGLDLGANTKITVNTNDLIKKYTNSGGGSSLTGTIFKDAFGSTGTDTFISINHVSSSGDAVEYNQVDITADNTALGASAQLTLDTQAVFKVNTSAGQHRLAFDGMGTGSLTAPGEIKIDAGGNGTVYLGDGSDIVKLKYNDANGYFNSQIENGYINVNAALVALSNSIGGGGGGVSEAAVTGAINNATSSVKTAVTDSYKQLRVFGKGLIQTGSSPANRVTFLLSGSSTTTQNTGSNVLKGLYGMSDANASTLLQTRVGALSFDVALYDGGSQSWTNDLVSVYITASQGDNGSLFYPKFVIDAPGASDGTEIRLIVVNENPEDFDIV